MWCMTNYHENSEVKYEIIIVPSKSTKWNRQENAIWQKITIRLDKNIEMRIITRQCIGEMIYILITIYVG